MDFNLVDQAAEQAAKTESLEHACAEYLYSRFDWSTRTAEVEEMLSVDSKALTSAHTRFMQGYGLDLQLLFNKAAMTLCEASAKTLVRGYGANWRVMLEGGDWE